MLPIKPALPEFPSDFVRDQFDKQFDKIFSNSNIVPAPPKIYVPQTQNKGIRAEMSSQTEQQAD